MYTGRQCRNLEKGQGQGQGHAQAFKACGLRRLKAYGQSIGPNLRASDSGQDRQ